MFHLRHAKGLEVDLIIEEGNRLTYAEIGIHRPAVRLLSKPWTISELVSCVREVLDGD